MKILFLALIAALCTGCAVYTVADVAVSLWANVKATGAGIDAVMRICYRRQFL
jgi:hypothetical protein